jgi:hypothetical protein
MKKYFLTLMACCVISCDENASETQFTPINLVTELILDGQLVPNQFNANGEQHAINDENSYQTLINQITPIMYNTYTDNGYTSPFDYNLYSVICIISKQQFYLSNRIVLDSVIENEIDIKVTYHVAIINEVQPALEQIVYIFKIPSTCKPIVFNEQVN